MDGKKRVAFQIAPMNLIGVLNNYISKRKKTNVADTSREAYGALNREGKIELETAMILRLIEEHQPITSRRLCYISRKERGNITRSLYNLVESGKIKYPFTAPCPVTNKRVRWYTLTAWEEAKND